MYQFDRRKSCSSLGFRRQYKNNGIKAISKMNYCHNQLTLKHTVTVNLVIDELS